MAKKLVLFVLLFTFTFLLSSCGDSYVEVEYIDVDCGPGMITIGETIDLYVTILPYDATNQGFDIHVDDNSILTILNDHQVQGLAEGFTWVSVTSHDKNYMNACSVYVMPAAPQ
jgi:hypothetical protein